MLQLYKSRDFSLFFKDTFEFIRTHGKHFFKNYIKVNGLFLVVLVAMSYIFYAEVAEIQALGLLDDRNYQEFLRYLDANSNVYVTYGIFYILLGGFVGILTYAYIPFYFKLYERHNGANFTSKDLSNELFANFGKLIKFLLATILISIPVIIAAGIVTTIMVLTIIGALFVIFIWAFVSFFYHTALMEYIKHEDKGVFDCYSYSLRLCFQKFFPTIGAVGIFMLLIGIFQFVVGLIQSGILYFFGISIFDDPAYLSYLDKTSFVFIIAFTLQIVTYIINFITSAVLQIHQAIVYYGLKEDRENIHTQSTIDSIGKN